MVFLLRLKREAGGGGGRVGRPGSPVALQGQAGDPGCSPPWRRTPAGHFRGLLIPSRWVVSVLQQEG